MFWDRCENSECGMHGDCCLQNWRRSTRASHKPELMMTFERFVVERWEPNILPMLRHSTARNYGHMIRRHLTPFFGTLRLPEIGPAARAEIHCREIEAICTVDRASASKHSLQDFQHGSAVGVPGEKSNAPGAGAFARKHTGKENTHP